MSKIDTSKWKYFSMKELGFKNYHGRRLTKKNRIDGNIPMLTAGYENQGIAQYIGNDCKIYSDSITIDMFGNVFYHDYDVTGDDNIYFFVNDKIGSKEKLFIVSSLTSINSQKYAFKDQFRQDDADNLIVKLPQDKNSNPDWEFMKQYIDEETKSVETLIKQFSKVNLSAKNKIDIDSWKEFNIGKLFPKIISPKVYHVKDVEEDKNGIPYVVRSKYNNGVKFFVKKTNNLIINPAGVISFGAENATFFYQENEYISGRDMYYIDTRNLTKNCSLFITSCLQQITEKYSYNYGLFPNLLKKESIKLPADDNGNPDWKYMDNYIENLKYWKF